MLPRPNSYCPAPLTSPPLFRLAASTLLRETNMFVVDCKLIGQAFIPFDIPDSCAVVGVITETHDR